MLAAPNRLRDRRAIAAVMRRGRYVATESLSVKAAPNRLAYSRAVVVVSKKVSKKAVVRNRIRRRLAAILAERWATVAPGYDIVVTARDDVAAQATAELQRHVAALLKQASLLTASK
jgi:ribonuclease P protein component